MPEKIPEVAGVVGGSGVLAAVVTFLLRRKGVSPELCNAFRADVGNRIDAVQRSVERSDASSEKRHADLRSDMDRRFEDLKGFIRQNGFGKG